MPGEPRDAPRLSAARRVAARQLTESVVTEPSTPAEIVFDRLAQCRAALSNLLAAVTRDDPGQIPRVLLPYIGRWVIDRELEAWTAERRTGTQIRVVVDHDAAGLAGKLDAIEAADPAA